MVIAEKRRKDTRLIMLYNGLKGAASIPTNDLVPQSGVLYKSSFFTQTIRDWNCLADSFISASECAVDSVTKFTSLVRDRDYLP